MTEAQWKGITYFTPHEENSHGDRVWPEPEKMSIELMRKLDRARKLAGVPFIINSGHRAGDKKTHGSGEAVDIKCTSSGKRHRIMNALTAVGFVRRGIYDLHIHADVGKEEDGYAQDVLWWGKSD